MRILVLSGGISNEREVSLRSGANIVNALKQTTHKFIVADPSSKDFNLEKAAIDCDMVLPILHGKGGEDGIIQKQLERLNIPYLGSDYRSCDLTFNKVKFKEKIAQHGFLTPNWHIVNQQAFQASELRHKPFVLKPIEGGSSIDTHIVHNPAHISFDVDKIFSNYDELLLEELIMGQEVTVAMLDKQPLPIILIIPPNGEEFDYENKYNGKSQEIVAPSEVAIEKQQEAQSITAKIHELVGCRHLSRTDIIISADGLMYVLETNTMPGLTEQSLFPKAAQQAGLGIEKLIEKFLSLVHD
jgi:D-alanine-D-alanine ligase